MVQASDGNFYGTTQDGGTWQSGTLFKIDSAGKWSQIYSFCKQIPCSDGSEPFSVVVEGTGENLYGTTSAGGKNGAGTLYKITPSGTLITRYSFCSQPE
jgi:uncharacterized repeat protein (TIGR03803 family)